MSLGRPIVKVSLPNMLVNVNCFGSHVRSLGANIVGKCWHSLAIRSKRIAEHQGLQARSARGEALFYVVSGTRSRL